MSNRKRWVWVSKWFQCSIDVWILGYGYTNPTRKCHVGKSL